VERLQQLQLPLVERWKPGPGAPQWRYLGRPREEVLVRGAPRDPSQLIGRTGTNRLTFFPELKQAGQRSTKPVIG